MPHVLIVHESVTVQEELTHALQAEGFTTLAVDTALAAVREFWQGSFDAAVIAERLPDIAGASLEENMRNLAPEIVTLTIGKQSAAKLAKRLAEILEGGAVAA
jgi:DNA-binding response OmpR family regulator